ncbi:MAG: CDP-glucose 4,6-dehydratase [Cellvibrionaceae bacterium]|jgi:CDP-glucose 4,6-dehydratase
MLSSLNTYKNRKVLITGHTGFKGSWLTGWCLKLGANVVGYSLPKPPTSPSNYELCNLGAQIREVAADINDFEQLNKVIQDERPEIIFHMAAQPLVLPSLEDPRTTFATNAIGTVNLLEAVRLSDAVRAVVCITTDKVYENKEWLWGYREDDRLGGKDPYSASKAMAELAIKSYTQSFFRPEWHGDRHQIAIASVRAGNVIGGGDFADFRLVPDCMKALIDDGPIIVRNPNYIRPWQHVLVPLGGYLLLGAKMLQPSGEKFDGAWNFGPPEMNGISTGQIADKLVDLWGSGEWICENPDTDNLETSYLRLSWEKAARQLNWRPGYDWEDTLKDIVEWYKAWDNGDDLRALMQAQIEAYTQTVAK